MKMPSQNDEFEQIWSLILSDFLFVLLFISFLLQTDTTTSTESVQPQLHAAPQIPGNALGLSSNDMHRVWIHLDRQGVVRFGNETNQEPIYRVSQLMKVWAGTYSNTIAILEVDPETRSAFTLELIGELHAIPGIQPVISIRHDMMGP